VEWRIGWIPLGGYVKFAGDATASSNAPNGEALDEMRRQIRMTEGVGAERRYFHFKPVWQRALVVAAGPAANFLLSIVLFSSLLFAFGDMVWTPRVDLVTKGSAAERAGFKPGDLVTAINGRPIDDFQQLSTYVMIRPGQTMQFTVKRGGGTVELTATPDLREKTVELTGGVTRAGVLGIGIRGTRDEFHRRRYGPVQAVEAGVARCADVIETTLTYLGRVATGRAPPNQLGGIVGMAAATHGAVQAGAAGAPNAGLMLASIVLTLLSVAATISVGIGFVNLLPVPVLDGGHLLFYAYEAAARRPVGARVQAAGYRVGLALLLGLMLFAAWNDLQQLRVFHFLGGLIS
jgi:regulator of sigma E protease